MNLFLYAIIILFSLSVMAQVSWIANDDFPKRTRKAVVWDAFFNFLFTLWAVYLLANQ